MYFRPQSRYHSYTWSPTVDYIKLEYSPGAMCAGVPPSLCFGVWGQPSSNVLASTLGVKSLCHVVPLRSLPAGLAASLVERWTSKSRKNGFSSRGEGGTLSLSLYIYIYLSMCIFIHVFTYRFMYTCIYAYTHLVIYILKAPESQRRR